MPEIPIDSLTPPETSGVAVNRPPAELLPEISTRLKSSLSNLPPGKSGGLFYVETDKGRNIAVVHGWDGDKFDFQVGGSVGFIGKDWGKRVWSVDVAVTW